jgi:methylated-DNA-[protein]-cysteine S-methyltransferase
MTDLEARLRGSAAGLDAPSPALPDLTEAASAGRLLDVAYTTLDSPLGELLLAATPRGLVRVSYLDGDLEAALHQLAARVSPRVLAAPRVLDPARRELDEYFAGSRRDFDLALDWQLTAGFGRRVLQATATIPFGGVSSYGKVAAAAGSARGARAAGNALGANPLPIVVPCHRILHAGGGLGGYTGGVERKRLLLALEAR